MRTPAGVFSGSRSRMKAVRKSPHALTMAHTAMVARPGRAIGRTTWRSICNGLAPKTRALSSYDFGVASMKSLRMKIAAGSSPPVSTSDDAGCGRR